MKTKILILILLPFISCGPKAAEEATASPKAKTGFQAPNFTLDSIENKKISLSNFKGKVVLLDFWATWCPPCRVSTPSLVRINKKFKNKDFAILGISLDEDVSPVIPFIKKEKVEHTILYSADSGIEKNYSIRAIPTFFLIDKDGIIQKRYDGFYPEMKKEWESEIPILLSR